MASGELIVIFLIGLLLVLRTAGVLGTRGPRFPRGLRPGEAACAACGYAVASDEELGRGVCPECGGRYRDVGLVTSQMRVKKRTPL